ncbi:MAG: IS1634 family transposase, partial [Deltaproteobacteria bacterium]|nr:IS1634 family transposase [Deltaproteobacteria bacterium]
EEFGSVFIANELEKMIDTIGIVDSIVKPDPREKGPSVGEYFFYAWANRLIEPKSKNAIGEWYRKTAMNSIRRICVSDLTSAKYWEKWNRVSPEQVEAIARAFFEKVWAARKRAPECVLFDTTNYYSYMASSTKSEFFERGHNKDGKHHLRQIGLALLVDSDTRLPLFYREYRGNEHDSKVFHRVIDEMFGALCGFNQTKARMTVVFDKGMNSEDNIAFIDNHRQIHFITTYSTYFAEELARKDLKYFRPLKIEHNAGLSSEDLLLAYRTSLELWGRERVVVVTLNPRTQRKKLYTFRCKLEKVRQALLEFRRKYRRQRPHWKDFKTIKDRYTRLCDQMHIGSQYYHLELTSDGKALSFRKNQYEINKAESGFGRQNWSTEEIVQASLDRWIIEKEFRDTKSSSQVAVQPMFHWTDSKIRCHLLTCVIALTMKRLLELKVEPALGKVTAEKIIEEMRTLDSLIIWQPGAKKPHRQLAEPTKFQNDVLKAFGYHVNDSWVLQRIES